MDNDNSVDNNKVPENSDIFKIIYVFNNNSRNINNNVI